MSAVDAAIDLLKKRMSRSNSGWISDEKRILELYEGGIFRAAACQAVHEAIWNVANAGVEEEPLVASLIGGLTSCLSWYSLLAELDEEVDGRRHCDVYWAHQPRHVERWNGADFGIARRIPGEEFLRISLYQAKTIKPGAMFDLYRDIRPEKISDANASLIEFLSSGKHPCHKTSNLHQIHKLIKTQIEGAAKDNMGYELGLPKWVRYVFWFVSDNPQHALQAPCVIPIEPFVNELRVRVLSKIGSDNFELSRRYFKFDPGEYQNTNLFSDFITTISDNGDNDLKVVPDVARELIGQLAQIGISDFFICDESGDGGEFWRQIFSLSNLSVTFRSGTSDIDSKPSVAYSKAPPGP